MTAKPNQSRPDGKPGSGPDHGESPIGQSGVYNPAREAPNEEAIVACRWELLRRNPRFQEIARQWAPSERFRARHALVSEYKSDHAARCALDWMLTPVQRIKFARFQIQNHRWMREPQFNFGPIICTERISTAWLTRKRVVNAYDLKPLPNPPAPITIGQPWNKLPEQFRAQFRAATSNPVPAFESITDFIGKGAQFLRVAGLKLADGDRLRESKLIAHWLVEIGNDLHELATNHRLYRFRRGPFPRKKFDGYIEQIKGDTEIISEKKYNRHKSYLGTVDDWRWFLEAESRGLNIHKSADLYRLAELYCHDLRHRKLQNQAPDRVQAHGFTSAPFKSKIIKARRSAVKRHVVAIQRWIAQEYPSSR